MAFIWLYAPCYDGAWKLSQNKVLKHTYIFISHVPRCSLCHRNFGIGGDGVIFALKAPEGELGIHMRDRAHFYSF